MPPPRFPGVLGEIAEVAGEEAALKLGAAYGGTRVSFPARIKSDDHWLVTCVGRPAAEAICDYFRQGSCRGIFHGVYLLVPRGSDTKIALHTQIIKLRESGLSAAKIGRQLNLSERAVFRHLAKARIESKGRSS
ncbi:hypothetical protein [Rhodopseudomonas parapalustris]